MIFLTDTNGKRERETYTWREREGIQTDMWNDRAALLTRCHNPGYKTWGQQHSSKLVTPKSFFFGTNGTRVKVQALGGRKREG